MTEPSAPQLVDVAALQRQRARMRGADPAAMYLHAQARAGIEERLSFINRPLSEMAVVTGHPELWADLRPNVHCVADRELLDLAPQSLDCVVHAMCLHWANDPVGQLIQCRRALRPDGVLLAVFPAGATLATLRACLAEAEAAVTGGLSPRVLPMGEVRDLGGLLQRAGLALPVADSETVTADYPSALALMRDLRAMGETNALAARPRHFTRRGVLLEAMARYPTTPEGRISVAFELITLTGWAPAADQPQPLRPGSARTRLADALKVPEQPLGRDTA